MKSIFSFLSVQCKYSQLSQELGSVSLGTLPAGSSSSASTATTAGEDHGRQGSP